MNDEQQLIDLAAELHRLIEQDPPASCADTLKLIEKDPRMLMEGIRKPDGSGFFYPAPLNYAIYLNNLSAADAILKILTDKKHAKTIRDYVTRDLNTDVASGKIILEKIYKNSYPFDNILYSASTLDGGVARFLPHAYVQSTEMLELLHRHHYDLHLKRSKSQNSPLTNLQKHVIANFKDYFDIDRMPVSFFRAFVELAVDQNIKSFYKGAADAFIRANFANQFFTTIATSCADGRISDKIMEKWALAGLDFRAVIKKEYQTNMLAENVTKVLQCRQSATNLKAFCKTQADAYLNSPNTELARAACAGEWFPWLLGRCVERDKKSGAAKEVPLLISHLDDYWKGEYRQMIRVADASTIRATYTKPEAATLGMYARDADVLVGVPRA